MCIRCSVWFNPSLEVADLLVDYYCIESSYRLNMAGGGVITLLTLMIGWFLMVSGWATLMDKIMGNAQWCAHFLYGRKWQIKSLLNRLHRWQKQLLLICKWSMENVSEGSGQYEKHVVCIQKEIMTCRTFIRGIKP